MVQECGAGEAEQGRSGDLVGKQVRMLPDWIGQDGWSVGLKNMQEAVKSCT